MSLDAYEKKRDFSKTEEPKPRMGKRRKRALRFLVHKHAASRLHYDLRLELDGVLLSWAVPKGPSTNPRDKRLAVQVEDHPLDYKDFEGTIPKGEYGGGTVMLWDEGTWEPLGDPHAMLASGDLKINLSGNRLRGSWALVRMKPKNGEEDKNWLLIKEKDDTADGEDVTGLYTTSVRSGRSMEEIAAGRRAKKGKRAAQPAAPLLPDASVALATLREHPPTGDGWLTEIKVDGYRILCEKQGTQVTLKTRNGIDYTPKFPELTAALSAWKAPDCVLDGEVAVFAEGISSFAALQAYLKGEGAPPNYVVFDLLYLDGDVRARPLTERKRRLQTLLEGAPEGIVFSSHMDADPGQAFAAVCAKGLEGIVTKRADSAYTAGRSERWIKVKCANRQEFLVLGYTVQKRALSSLLLGVSKDGALQYVGRAGTGFTDAQADTLRRTFKPLQVDTPAADVPRRRGETTVWLRPELIAEVSFASWTTGGLLRQASFKGLREDKSPNEVVRETAGEDDDAQDARPNSSRDKSARKSTSKTPGEDDSSLDAGSNSKPDKSPRKGSSKTPGEDESSQDARPNSSRDKSARKSASTTSGEDDSSLDAGSNSNPDKSPRKGSSKTQGEDDAPQDARPNTSRDKSARKSSSTSPGEDDSSQDAGSNSKPDKASRKGSSTTPGEDDSSQDALSNSSRDKSARKSTSTTSGEDDSPQDALPLSSPDKEMYAGVTKAQVYAYYQKVAARMLPYVRNRLTSLLRCPAGATGECFYQKHLEGAVPGMAETTIRESDGGRADYPAITDERGILSAVQLNALEFHVWGADLTDLERPDTMVFDLDPDVGLSLDALREGVRHLKGILDRLGLVSFLKTSGSKGYHIVVPLTPGAAWPAVRDFAQGVARAMEQEWPDKYTANVRKNKRKGRIFIDWIRNTRGATSVAPYSLRARAIPAVSCPIAWSDLPRIAPQDITIHNLFRRRKDPWKEYYEVRQGIT